MNNTKFKVIRGLDAVIQDLEIVDGHLYFATDSGKIYLDYKGERITMGGSGASLYYAEDLGVEANAARRYLIKRAAVPGEANVKIDDLIINADGCFYRVYSIETEVFICDRIAVSGTGGGGGSEGGGGTGAAAMTIECLTETGAPPLTYIYGQSSKVPFRVTTTYSARVCSATVTFVSDIYGSKTITYENIPIGQQYDLEIGSHVFEGAQSITLVFQCFGGSPKELFIGGVQGIQLQLKKSKDFNPKLVREDDLPFVCVPVGTIPKTLVIEIDGEEYGQFKIPANVSDGNHTESIRAQKHGRHALSAYLVAELNGVSVATDPIEYEVAWVGTLLEEDEEQFPIVWAPNGYPAEIVQYEDCIIEYMAWSPDKTTEIEVNYFKGSNLVTTREVSYKSDTILTWNITDYELGENAYTIYCGNQFLPINFNVIESDRDMDILSGGLVLNLDSAGRSNQESAATKTKWVSKDTSVNTEVIFNNFNWYNNGWLSDPDGTSFLRISNGASIEIPINRANGGLNILNSVKVQEALAFEFRFRVRNLQEYATLVTTSSKEVDGQVVISKEASTESGVFGSFYNQGVGFCLGTQEAFFKADNYIVSGRYREDEILNVTFVVDTYAETYPLLYVYLNGVLSGITMYSKDISFASSQPNIIINSDYCDVDLYKVRIYKSTKLNSADVMHNYIADIKDPIQYDVNQIVKTVDGVPTIDYAKMLDYNNTHPDQTIMPYMVIESLDSDGKLPYVKGGKKPVNVDFVNPAADYALEQGLITPAQYIASAPSFSFKSKKKSLDVQGTSSQGYPRRNYKLKCKQEDAIWRLTAGIFKDTPIYEYNAEKDKYYGSTITLEDGTEINIKKLQLDNAEIGESTFCLKADYMESSGTHNTGFASFVGTIYQHHPLYYYGITDAETKNLRTTIYGFPILVFQKKSNTDYEFIGRYNFNLDKGATDTDGFTFEGNSKVKKEDGTYYPIEEIAECWELKNNQGGRCSYRKTDFSEVAKESYAKAEDVTAESFEPDTYYTMTMEYNEETTTQEPVYTLATEFVEGVVYYRKVEGILTLHTDFEYRYSFYEDEIDAALEGKDDFATKTQEEKNAALLYRFRNFERLCEWLKSTDTAAATGAALPEPVKIGIATYATDTKEYRLAKFGAEFDKHLNREYCLNYYIMTELLHLYDSRGKNCMMATWGPIEEGGEYIWFPIFYDIDTQLGINNSGVPTWDYGVDPSDQNSFSTSDSVLWNNFGVLYNDAIQIQYQDLRKNSVDIDKLDGYYNSHAIFGKGEIQSWKQILEADNADALRSSLLSPSKLGYRPYMLTNVDQYFKYIAPTFSGYINTSGEVARDNGTFFYCLQGTRELMRYLYLRNRLNYLDSKWHAGTYAKEAAKQQFWSRFDANLYGLTSDNTVVTNDPTLLALGSEEKNQTLDDGTEIKGTVYYVEESAYPNALDTVADFIGFTPYLQQYVSLLNDDTYYPPIRYDGKTPLNIEFNEAVKKAVRENIAYTQQLVYFGGGEYIADLGDLSNKYFDELKITPLKRLKRLQLGSDVPGYFNSQLTKTKFQIGANKYNADGTLNENAKTLLSYVNLTGLSGYADIVDLSSCEKLTEFRALNSAITGVTLADGAQIEILHLPENVSTLNFIELTNLTEIIDSPRDADGNIRKGLYIKGLTDNTAEKTKVNTYTTIGGKLGYGTYTLLAKLVELKENQRQGDTTEYSPKLGISLKNVAWSPYEQVPHGTTYDPKTTYYVDNGRYQLEECDPSSNWDYLTLNGKLYTDNGAARVVTDFSLLDKFITSYEEAKTFYEETSDRGKEYFFDANADGTRVTLPDITGLLYVENADPVTELVLARTYGEYFPKLKIFCANVAENHKTEYINSVVSYDKVKTDLTRSEFNANIGKYYIVDKDTVDGYRVATEYEPTVEYYTKNMTDEIFFSAIQDGGNVPYPDEAPSRINYDFLGWSTSREAVVPMTKDEITALTFDETTTLYTFYAVYQITKFKYIFKNPNDTIAYEEDVAAGTKIINPMLNNVFSYSDTSLGLEECYKALGFVADKANSIVASENDFKKHQVVVENIISQNWDREFYICYMKVDVHENVASLDLFSFTPVDVVFEGTTYNGWQIAPKADIALSGKITLPAFYKGTPVVEVGCFANQKITHVFWEGGCQLRRVYGSGSNTSAFSRCSALEYFEFPETLLQISDYGFNGTAFKTLKFNNGLKKIGNAAFQGMTGTVTSFQFPGSLNHIGNKAFTYFDHKISEIIFGGPGDPTQINFVPSDAFEQNSPLGFNSIVYYSTVTPNDALEVLLGNIQNDGTTAHTVSAMQA